MMKILKCGKCQSYTLNEKCECGGIAVTVKPARYKVGISYSDYRRKAKEASLKEKGLL